MCEGWWLKAVTGGQVELPQPGTSLRNDLQTGFIQEMAAGQLEADQALTTGLHEAEGGRMGGGAKTYQQTYSIKFHSLKPNACEDLL